MVVLQLVFKGGIRQRAALADIVAGKLLFDVVPVSYTHLDVYKRPVLKIIPVGVLERIGVLFAHQKREGIQRALAYRFRQGAFNAALLEDVYKRQSQICA